MPRQKRVVKVPTNRWICSHCRRRAPLRPRGHIVEEMRSKGDQPRVDAVSGALEIFGRFGNSRIRRCRRRGVRPKRHPSSSPIHSRVAGCSRDPLFVQNTLKRAQAILTLATVCTLASANAQSGWAMCRRLVRHIQPESLSLHTLLRMMCPSHRNWSIECPDRCRAAPSIRRRALRSERRGKDGKLLEVSSGDVIPTSAKWPDAGGRISAVFREPERASTNAGMRNPWEVRDPAGGRERRGVPLRGDHRRGRRRPFGLRERARRQDGRRARKVHRGADRLLHGAPRARRRLLRAAPGPADHRQLGRRVSDHAAFPGEICWAQRPQERGHDRRDRPCEPLRTNRVAPQGLHRRYTKDGAAGSSALERTRIPGSMLLAALGFARADARQRGANQHGAKKACGLRAGRCSPRLWTEIARRVRRPAASGNRSGSFQGVQRVHGRHDMAHESAGRLPEGVRHVRDYVAQMREIRRESLRGASRIRLWFSSRGLRTTAILCVFTLPRFSRMLRDIGVMKTNHLTSFFFGLSDFVLCHPICDAAALSPPPWSSWLRLGPLQSSGSTI